MYGMQLDGAGAAGFDADRLRRAFALLDGWIDAGVLPGAAALVARGGQVAGEAYLGLAHRAEGWPVDSGTIWDVASITKPVTATAAMLLVERGVLSLDEPLVQYLPEFADGPYTEYDRAAVTLRHIFAHCSGLPGFLPDNVPLRSAHAPLADFVRSWLRAPVLFAPGACHLYSNVGILLAAEVIARAATDTLGRAVAAPMIEAFHPFVRDEILAPLGMGASSLLPPEAWWERIAWVEDTGQGAAWEMGNSPYFRRLGVPWGGLYTRPRDLVRLVDASLPEAAGRGRVGFAPGTGPRLLSPATVRTMTTVQFAPPDASLDLAPELREGVPSVVRPRVPWGVGWSVREVGEGGPPGELLAPGAFGHGGSTGTLTWADPASGVACVLLTNRATASGWTSERPRLALFSNAVLAAAL